METNLFSRQALVAWVYEVTQLEAVQSVEQMGKGAALCQIYDSIYMDVPMSKVNFAANTEVDYIANLKILQNTFTRHRIDRIVPIQSLAKCKMQDNLEFLQWTRRFHMEHFPGAKGSYDALGRRSVAARPPANELGNGAGPAGGARRGTIPKTGGAKPGARAAGGGAASAALVNENNQLKETVTGLERERDFYFSKLRDIELLLQQAVELDPEIEKDEDGLVKNIQAILYSTEDGFEIPAEEGAQDDLETF